MLDFDTKGVYRMAALQSEAGRELLPRCGRRSDDISSIVLVERDGCFTKRCLCAAINCQQNFLHFVENCAGCWIMRKSNGFFRIIPELIASSYRAAHSCHSTLICKTWALPEQKIISNVSRAVDQRFDDHNGTTLDDRDLCVWIGLSVAQLTNIKSRH